MALRSKLFPKHKHIHYGYSRQELADYLGCSKVTLYKRLRKEFKNPCKPLKLWELVAFIEKYRGTKTDREDPTVARGIQANPPT